MNQPGATSSRRRFLAGTGTLSLGAIPAATVPAGHPERWAVRGVRVVTGTGVVLESATLEMTDGLIAAITDRPPSAGFRVLEGKGLTAYPGMLDLGSSLGLPTPPAGSGTTVTPAAPPQQAHVRAAELLVDPGPGAQSARAAGITTVLVAPNRGVLAGQSALINLNGDPATAIVTESVFQHAQLSGGGFGVYPSSLMGVLAFLRQSLLDAAHYEAAWKLYQAHRRELPRPSIDRALEALGTVTRRQQALVLPASTTAQMRRMLRLVGEFQLQPVISGGWEAEEMGEELKTAHGVVVSLRFPVAPSGEEASDTLRDARLRHAAPRAAAALHRGGIRFGFGSFGLEVADFRKSLIRVVKAGMDPAAVLRGVTLGAAELVGVSDVMGSLETGKMANVVLTDGDLFDEKSRVRHVFVDGKPFPIVAAAATPERRSAA